VDKYLNEWFGTKNWIVSFLPSNFIPTFLTKRFPLKNVSCYNLNLSTITITIIYRQFTIILSTIHHLNKCLPLIRKIGYIHLPIWIIFEFKLFSCFYRMVKWKCCCKSVEFLYFYESEYKNKGKFSISTVEKGYCIYKIMSTYKRYVSLDTTLRAVKFTTPGRNLGNQMVFIGYIHNNGKNKWLKLQDVWMYRLWEITI